MLRIFADVIAAADFFEQLPFAEFIAKDDCVDGPVLFVELYQHIENDLVIGLKKGFAVDDLHSLADDVFFKHHRRQQGTFQLRLNAAATGRIAGATEGFH